MALALVGCSAPQTRALKAEPSVLSASTEILATPFFPQTRYHCGPAALATVLKFRDIDVLPDDLVEEVYLPGRKGSLQTEMIAAARGRGMLAYPLDDRLHALLREIDAGNPVLVMQNLGLDWWPQWHYAVAIGYDMDAGHIVLRSGTRERHVLALSTFERTWTRAGRWALVVASPGTVPETADLKVFLKTALDFERTDQLPQARRAYAAAAVRWPDSAPTQLALGNAAYRLGALRDALTAFEKAVALQPRNASAWNNLAWSLHASGCPDDARRALRCAVALQPQDPEINRSWKELGEVAAPPASDAGHCSVARCPIQ
ncbi:MAG: PA2778 family cysteine peptidase [Gammaproteobacteria bacterium]|nr:PA2778 family cysteine peptidase [Gammaproteobacteria bacterium]